MGVDCQITLPANVQLRDVADVAAALLGCKRRKNPLGSSHPGAWYVTVDGVTTKPCGVTECASIDITETTAGDGGNRHLLYHFEFGADGSRGLMPRSTAVNIAMAKGLVDFFGGSVDFADCDDVEVDYSVPAKSNEENHPEDGEPWQALEERKFAVKPLTKAQIKDCEQYAAYH